MDFVDLIDDHPLFVAFLVVAALVGLCVIPSYFSGYTTCSSKASVLNTDFQYGLFKGCFIKEDGKWIDYDRYRIVNQE